MPAGLQVWDASGNIVFNTGDRVAGNIASFTTGTANGSHTASPPPGQSVEYVYVMPSSWTPAGRASPWPVISVFGNTISWVYNPSVPSEQRAVVGIMEVTY